MQAVNKQSVTPATPPVYAWRFAHPDGTSDFQDDPQEVGLLYSLRRNDPPIDPGHWGYHGCELPLSALFYSSASGGEDNRPYTTVERVRLSGFVVCDMIPDKWGSVDQCAASERTILWRADARWTLCRFAADFAGEVLSAAAVTAAMDEPPVSSHAYAAVAAVHAFLAVDEGQGKASPEAAHAAHAVDDAGKAAHRSLMGVRPNTPTESATLAAAYAAYAISGACLPWVFAAFCHGLDVMSKFDRQTGQRRQWTSYEGYQTDRAAERARQNAILHARLMELRPHSVDNAPRSQAREPKGYAELSPSGESESGNAAILEGEKLPQ